MMEVGAIEKKTGIITFAAHQATTAFNRTATLEGRQYLVAPVIAVCEGVLNGMLAPADEIGKHIEAWNGIPLPVYHPRERGQHVSANRPDLIESMSVGRFFNASFDGRALRGELWVDVEKCRTLGGDALQALERLEQGQPLEVSTAYFHDTEQTSGTFSGRAYNGIQRNLRPDHLALLPGEVGACNWGQGCGAPRVNCKMDGGTGCGARQGSCNEGGMESVKDWLKKPFAAMASFFGANQGDLSHSDLENRLRAALKERTEWAFIHDVFEDSVVYDDQAPDKPVRLLQRGYTIDENNVITLSDEFEPVVRVTRYEPVNPPAANVDNNPGGESADPPDDGTGKPAAAPAANNATAQKGDDGMKKPEIINALIANSATQFGEQDRTWLDALTEEQLTKLTPPAANEGGEKPPCSCTGTAANEGAKPAEVPATEPAANKVEPKPQTMEEYIKAIPDPDLREFVVNSQKRQKEHREKLIADLAANSQCAFDKDELVIMATNQLEKLAKSISVDVDYSLMGGPRVDLTANTGDEIPAAPSVILAKREAK